MLKNVDKLCEPAWHLQPQLGWQRPVLQSCGCTSEQDTFHDKVMQSSPESLPQCDDCHTTIALWAPKNIVLWPQVSAEITPADTRIYPPASIKPDIFSQRTPQTFIYNRRPSTTSNSGSLSWGNVYLKLFQNDSPRHFTPESQARARTLEMTDDTFEDVITLEPIRNPRTFACGHTFDRMTFSKLQACLCPLCRHPAVPWIFDNHAVAALCDKAQMLNRADNNAENPFPLDLINFHVLKERADKFLTLANTNIAPKVPRPFPQKSSLDAHQCLDMALNHQPLHHEARLQRAALYQKQGDLFSALMDLHSYTLAHPNDATHWKQTVALANDLNRPDFIARLGNGILQQEPITFWQARDVLQAAVLMQAQDFRIDEKFRAQHLALNIFVRASDFYDQLPINQLLAWHLSCEDWRLIAAPHMTRQRFFEQLILTREHHYAASLFKQTPVDCAALRSILTIYHGLVALDCLTTYQPNTNSSLWTVQELSECLEIAVQKLDASGRDMFAFLKMVASAYIISFEHTSQSEFLKIGDLQDILATFLSVQLERPTSAKIAKVIAQYILEHLGDRCSNTICMIANNTLASQCIKTHSTTRAQLVAATSTPKIPQLIAQKRRHSWVHAVTSRFTSTPEFKLDEQTYLFDSKLRSIFV